MYRYPFKSVFRRKKKEETLFISKHRAQKSGGRRKNSNSREKLALFSLPTSFTHNNKNKVKFILKSIISFNEFGGCSNDENWYTKPILFQRLYSQYSYVSFVGYEQDMPR